MYAIDHTLDKSYNLPDCNCEMRLIFLAADNQSHNASHTLLTADDASNDGDVSSEATEPEHVLDASTPRNHSPLEDDFMSRTGASFYL